MCWNSGVKVAFEIVLDDEDAEEIRIAAGAEDVPGKSGEAEGRDGGGMKEAEGVGGQRLRRSAQKKNGAAAENNGRRAFRQDSEAEEETRKDESKPGRSRKDRRVFVASEARTTAAQTMAIVSIGAKRQSGGGGVRKADHADRGWKQ